MDQRLISWAAAVKSRNRHRTHQVPPLWLFTDEARVPDPRGVAARLPKGLCGVVLRHDHAADRTQLGRDLARICRAQRNLLVVAGDPKLAHQLRAGLHLRGGTGPKSRIAGALVTSSAHNAAQIAQARQATADAVFVSPLFTTASHPGARHLGLVRWLLVSSKFHGPRLALGGLSPAKLRYVAVRQITGLGAISCFGS